MQILIATTGATDPGPVVHFTEALVNGGTVTVTTVIEVPRTFLDTIRSERWHPLEPGDTAPWSSKEDAVIARYVEERGQKLTEPVIAALRSRGIKATAMYLEGEDPVRVIVKAARKVNADIIVLGATRKIFDESAWESVSARVMIESDTPVLVVPAAKDTPIDAQAD